MMIGVYSTRRTLPSLTLDEGSTLMQAFESGRGYWERDAIHEICLAAFGKDEGAWSIEQRHWYGEMMVAVGAWDRNDFLLPGEGDLTEQEARKLAVMALKDAYSIELPLESTKDWHVGIGFVSNYYEEGENSYWIVEWQINFSRPEKPNVLVYDVSFDRHGNNIQTDHHEEPEIDERALQRYAELMTNATKEQEAMKK